MRVHAELPRAILWMGACTVLHKHRDRLKGTRRGTPRFTSTHSDVARASCWNVQIDHLHAYHLRKDFSPLLHLFRGLLSDLSQVACDDDSTGKPVHAMFMADMRRFQTV